MTERKRADWSAAKVDVNGTLIVPLTGAVSDPYYSPALREVFSQWEGGQRNGQSWSGLEAYPDHIVVRVTEETSPEDLLSYVEQGLASAVRVAPMLAQAAQERRVKPAPRERSWTVDSTT